MALGDSDLLRWVWPLCSDRARNTVSGRRCMYSTLTLASCKYLEPRVLGYWQNPRVRKYEPSPPAVLCQ